MESPNTLWLNALEALKNENRRGIESDVKKGSTTAIMQLLEQAIVSVTFEDKFGRTLLSYAAEHGNLQAVELLLEKSG